MDDQNEKKPVSTHESLPTTQPKGELVNTLFPMTSSQALNHILDQENALQIVQEMSRMDFYWLIKKIGEDDSLSVLKLASEEQWQHLFDLEIWQRDEVDLATASQWLGRLHLADPERLAKWLLNQGSGLTYYYFFKILQVFIREEDDLPDIPDDYFTLDNVYFIRILDEEHEETIRDILKHLAAYDHTRYQSLLVNLAGILPAEHEEGMSRVRNIRLAEEGFLPFEEAIAVYSYRKPDAFNQDPSGPSKIMVRTTKAGEEEHISVPLVPLLYAQRQNLLLEASKRIMDPILLDRIRLEFAGLCNQILSADGVKLNELEDLIKICRKAAGYIHLGLERLAGQDVTLAADLVKKNTLLPIFQIGFSRVLELKWEAERWVKKSWFRGVDLNPDFWGEEWGGTLKGLLQKRPRLYTRAQKEEMFKEFQTSPELNESRLVLQHLMVLDRLLEHLATRYTIFKTGITKPFFIFHTLLFNFWGRKQLSLEPGFGPLSLAQVRDLFSVLRGESRKQPFEMMGYQDKFVEDLMAYAQGWEAEAAGRLKETLKLLWIKFNEEYEWIATADLDGRYSKFIKIKPSQNVVLH